MPDLRSMQITSVLTELGALKRVQVWLALVVGMVGFGGMFAVYTYISTTLTEVAGLPRTFVPVALVVFGVGMVVGNLVGGQLAHRSVMRALYLSMGAQAVVLAIFIAASHRTYTALPVLFLIGATSAAFTPALQTRLMDVAADARTLAGALTHCALNIGNAAGAWLGGLVKAHEKLAAMVKPDTRVVPANGRLLSGAELRRQHQMFAAFHERMVVLQNKGYDSGDCIAAKPLQDFTAQYGDADKFVHGAFQSLNLAYSPD
jgi:predicted MFS family arabinose efflux permease